MNNSVFFTTCNRQYTDLSVIVTASLIKSHPSIRLIKKTLESFKYFDSSRCHIILAHDFSEDPRFILYLNRLKAYIQKQIKFNLVTICVLGTHGHLTGSIRNAMKYVNSQYLLFVQHDMPFVRPFDVKKMMFDMDTNPMLKHVRFNRRVTKWYGDGWTDSRNDLFGMQLHGDHYIYTRTPAWSDNNHLTSFEYYKEYILPQCPDGTPMEETMDSEDYLTVELLESNGTYILGAMDEQPFIRHTDGKHAKRNYVFDMMLKYLKFYRRKIKRKISGRPAPNKHDYCI